MKSGADAVLWVMLGFAAGGLLSANLANTYDGFGNTAEMFVGVALPMLFSLLVGFEGTHKLDEAMKIEERLKQERFERNEDCGC